ncbi:MAG TPA: recE, partial [Alphaproteobacteria bacterium]|nr:recE [Alphaproteobacteria bacterium]
PHYRDGLAACLGCDPDDIDFVFVVVETEPPYLVATYRINTADAELGREQNRIAREIYADCTASGIWPGYSEEIEELQLRYYDRQRIKREIDEWHD